jgi:hypothetical protein
VWKLGLATEAAVLRVKRTVDLGYGILQEGERHVAGLTLIEMLLDETPERGCLVAHLGSAGPIDLQDALQQ